MRTKETAVGLLLVALLITTVGFILAQHGEILSLREQIGAGDGERGDVGAWISKRMEVE